MGGFGIGTIKIQVRRKKKKMNSLKTISNREELIIKFFRSLSTDERTTFIDVINELEADRAKLKGNNKGTPGSRNVDKTTVFAEAVASRKNPFSNNYNDQSKEVNKAKLNTKDSMQLFAEAAASKRNPFSKI